MFSIHSNFLIGCVGAIAPEAWRLYNLRTQPVFRWSWSYLLFSIPFVLVGGFIAWTLEPTTKWAAFYSGLTTPILLTAALKDTAKAQKDLEDVEAELNQAQQVREKLSKENKVLIENIKSLRKLIIQHLGEEVLEDTLESKHLDDLSRSETLSTVKRRSSDNIQVGSSEYSGNSESSMLQTTTVNYVGCLLFIGTALVLLFLIARLISQFISIALLVAGIITFFFVVRFIFFELKKTRKFQEFLKGI